MTALRSGMSRMARVAVLLAFVILASGPSCGRKEPAPSGTGASAGGTAGDVNHLAAPVLPSGKEASPGAKVRAVIVPPSPSKLIPPRVSVQMPGGEPVKAVQVRWKVGGGVVSEGERLSPSLFRKGDTISALVTAETAEGPVSVETPAVTAVKSLPSVTDVRLEPAPVRAGSTVRAVARGESPDGGPLTFRYRWFINDIQFGGDAAELTLKDVGKGKWVHVQVFSNDGVSDGSWKYSPKYKVANALPVVRSGGPPILSAEGVLTCTIIVSDPDGDPLKMDLVSGPPEMILSGNRITWKVPEGAFGRPAEAVIRISDPDGGFVTHTLNVTPRK